MPTKTDLDRGVQLRSSITPTKMASMMAEVFLTTPNDLLPLMKVRAIRCML